MFSSTCLAGHGFHISNTRNERNAIVAIIAIKKKEILCLLKSYRKGKGSRVIHWPTTSSTTMNPGSFFWALSSTVFDAHVPMKKRATVPNIRT